MRMVLLSAIVTVVFQVLVIVFAASAESSQVRQLPKWAWVLACVLFPVLGGVAYLVWGRPVSGALGFSSNPQGNQRSGSGPSRRRAIVGAPDDDPEFLRELQRRIERDQKAANDESGETPNTQPGDEKPDSGDQK